jgi:hypothetical protein
MLLRLLTFTSHFTQFRFWTPFLLATYPLPVSAVPHEIGQLYATPYRMLVWDPGAQSSATHQKMAIQSHGASYLSFMAYLVFHVASALQHLLVLTHRPLSCPFHNILFAP